MNRQGNTKRGAVRGRRGRINRSRRKREMLHLNVSETKVDTVETSSSSMVLRLNNNEIKIETVEPSSSLNTLRLNNNEIKLETVEPSSSQVRGVQNNIGHIAGLEMVYLKLENMSKKLDLIDQRVSDMCVLSIVQKAKTE